MPSLIPITEKFTDEQITAALDAVLAAHPVLSMRIDIRDSGPYLVMGEKPAVLKGSYNLVSMVKRLTTGFDITKVLSRHMIVRCFGKCYLVSVVHHIVFDVISGNVFKRVFLNALNGVIPTYVDDAFLKVSAFHQQVQNTDDYAQMDKYTRSMMGNFEGVGLYKNPGKPGRTGYVIKELTVSREQVKKCTEKFRISKNILFTVAKACTMSSLTGKDKVFYGFVENGRDRFRNYDAIGLYINTMPLVAKVGGLKMGELIEDFSDMYYMLNRYNFYSYGPTYQEFDLFPVTLFQFLPDWVIDDGGYDELPLNKHLIDLILSRFSDLLVQAIIEVVEKKNGYALRIYYSGYYTKAMMKTFADTYDQILCNLMEADENTASKDVLIPASAKGKPRRKKAAANK